ISIFRQPAPDLSQHMIRSYEPLAITVGTVQSPQMVSRGTTTALAWVENDPEGRQRVRALKLADARLQPSAYLDSVTTVDRSETGNNSSPALAINPVNHTPGVVWVHSDDVTNSLYYASLNGD